MDRNQTIGIVLLAFLFLGYWWTLDKVPEEQPVAKTENIENVQVLEKQTAIPFAEGDSVATVFEEKVFDIVTDELKVTFSNKGGKLLSVELLNYTDQNEEHVKLFDGTSAALGLSFPTKEGKLDLFEGEFSTANVSASVEGTDTLAVVFTKLLSKPGQFIQHTYKIAGSGFLVDYNAVVNGVGDDVTTTTAELSFIDNLKSFERAVKVSRQKSTINYYVVEEDDFDDIGAGNEEELVEGSIAWFSFKQRFFNTSIIPAIPVTKAFFESSMSDNDPKDDSPILGKSLKAEVNLAFNGAQNLNQNIKFYFGPNDYRVMKNLSKQYGIQDFDKNVYLGWSLFSYVNKWVVIPLFRFLEGYITNYGVIILILVLVIKMLLFPIAYKSYLSMAKMKELKPEIDKLKEEAGDDQMAVQQKSMALYGKVGVNPMSGCIPPLLQMPILLALFNFFPNFIELRHESFLWANDLSSYDDLISWSGVPIPFIGNHISLFTVLMTLSTLAYTYVNNQLNTAAQQGPMKIMGYLMPVMFFFVLNDFAAGLTWYYFVSNLITLSQQKIATLFIDKDKIRLKMEENRKNHEASAKSGGKVSGFRQRLAEAQKLRAEQTKNKKK